MNAIFTVTYFLWFLSEIFLNRMLRSKNTDKQNADKHSLLLIWITIIVSISVAVYISAKYYLPIYLNPSCQYIGIAIILAGIILRFIAVVSLGKLFTVDVTIRQNHQLKKNGLYKYLRHPSYFASFLSFVGFGISSNNWISLLLVVFAILVVFIIRIRIEEKVLISHFGSEYIEYKKITKRLIPFIY